MSKKILHIISSLKNDNSISNKLAESIINQLTESYPDSTVEVLNLSNISLPHLDETNFTSFTTPADNRNEIQKEAVKHTEKYITNLMESDIIVIGVPIYNFNIPSTLKAWIDHVVRAGTTFTFLEGYPKGMVNNKKVYLAIASGAIFSEGPMKSHDFAEPYLRTILGFIGMTDITTFRIEGTSIPEHKDNAEIKGLTAVNNFNF